MKEETLFLSEKFKTYENYIFNYSKILKYFWKKRDAFDCAGMSFVIDFFLLPLLTSF